MRKQLTNDQKDALTELINIGFGKAAQALSVLTGQRVVLEAPDADVYPLEELEKALSGLAGRDTLTVHQLFTGRLSGDMMLLFDMESANHLAHLMPGGPSLDEPFGIRHQDAMTELGNILLGAFAGTFGNLLRIQIAFAVPYLKTESVKSMFRTLRIDNKDLQYAVVVKVYFHLKDADVKGYLVIVMGIHSLDALLGAIQEQGYLV